MLTKEHADEIRAIRERLADMAAEVGASILSIDAYPTREGIAYKGPISIHVKDETRIPKGTIGRVAGDAHAYRWDEQDLSFVCHVPIAEAQR